MSLTGQVLALAMQQHGTTTRVLQHVAQRATASAWNLRVRELEGRMFRVSLVPAAFIQFRPGAQQQPPSSEKI